MIKVVFLDVANTLLFKPELFSNLQEAFKINGIAISTDRIRDRHKTLSEVITFPDTTSNEFYKEFNKQLCRSLGIVPDEKLLNDIYAKCLNLKWEPFEDCKFLNHIKLPMGIASNWDTSLEDKLNAFFTIDFKWIVGSAVSGYKKPELAFFNELVNVSGVAADEIIFVGDSIKLDVEPAMNFGMKALLIDRTDSFESSNVDRISSLEEIENWL